MCSDTMTSEEVRAVVEAALQDEDFPGYFLYSQVGIRGVRSSYGWVDASGRLWDRRAFELKWEYEQNGRGPDDVGSMMRWYQPDVFAMGVDALIEERLDSGDLFPLYYAD